MKMRRGFQCSELERDRQRKTEKKEGLKEEQAGNRTQVEMDSTKKYRVRDKKAQYRTNGHISNSTTFYQACFLKLLFVSKHCSKHW